MIKIARQDWAKFVRDNNPEAFTEEQITQWIESNKEILIKSEANELSEEDQKFVDDFRTEINHFTKVEVMGENPDKLIKALQYETFYIREQQIKWDEEIVKSEDGKETIEKVRAGVYEDTSLNRKLGRVGQRFGSKKSENKE